MEHYEVIYFGKIMYWDAFSGFLSAHFVTWCLFMVMLTNFVRTSNIHAPKSVRAERREVLLLSSIMFCSYALMIPIDHYIEHINLDSDYYPYSLYFALDVMTVMLIRQVIRNESTKGKLCERYLTVGLLGNSSLFLLLQIDLLLMYNDMKPSGAWWFWDVFTIGVNFFDALMISVLLFHKDILGFNKLLKNKLLNSKLVFKK